MNYLAEWDAKHAERPLWADHPLPHVREWLERVKPAYVQDDGLHRPTVLDVGCGTGTNTIWMSKNGFHPFAFDGSGRAICRLLDRAVNEKTIGKLGGVTVADATKPFPYRAESFDLVIEVRVIENLDETEAKFAYAQIARVLRHGGRLLSVTACEHRDDILTTVGVVRKTTGDQMVEFMNPCGLVVERIGHNDAFAADLVVEALKP